DRPVLEVFSDVNANVPDLQVPAGAQHLRTNGSVSLSNSDPESPVHLLDAQTTTRGVAGLDNRVPPSGVPSNYRSIGKYEHICEYCGALFWYEERLKSVGRNRRPKYGRCCKGGRVALRTYQIYPEYIKLLLQDRHFMENIRAYNQMFSMTSLGAHIDDSVNNGRGTYVFKISGQLYHWLGSLCPAEGEPPRFLQLYIYDTDNEVDNRMSHFGGQNSELRRDIVEGLIDMLDTHNALVHLFRTAREKLADTHIPNFKVRLYNVVGAREYELPTGDMLGAIVYEPGPETDMDYDIVIEERSGHPQRVNKLHSSYMSLQFPLLFPYGEDGYSKDLKLLGGTGTFDSDRRLTMKAYYAYVIHDRANCFNYLSRTGRLFQQYNRELLAREKEMLMGKLNEKQRRIFDLIMNACTNNQQELIFIYGHGGTCKTFLWKAVTYTLRAEGKIVLAVASSGVASLLLPAGRTSHSRFILPLDLTDPSVCSVKKNTQLSNLIKETSLIIWDEAPMNDRRCFETLDRTLRDILDT
ncbi:DNA helicase, partial [Tanacetum coccineum]